MASPQKENGYTAISNEIMDALISHRISGQEYQVVLFVIRKTYGFNKKYDLISMGQISEATGINRPKVCSIIKSLSKRNIVGVIQKDNSFINTLYFSKDYEKWRVLPKKITVKQGVIQKDNTLLPKKVTDEPETVTQKGNGVFPKKIHTKDSITKDSINIKDNITKDNMRDSQKNTNIKLFIDWFFEEFRKRFNEKYLVTGKDASITQRLLGTYTLDQLKFITLKFFESEDEFIKNAGYTIPILLVTINKIISSNPSKNEPKGFQALREYIKEREEKKVNAGQNV